LVKLLGSVHRDLSLVMVAIYLLGVGRHVNTFKVATQGSQL